MTVYALQSAGTMYEWDSAVICGTLTLGVFLFLLLATWEALLPHLTSSNTNRRVLLAYLPRVNKTKEYFLSFPLDWLSSESLLQL